ncbi:MAG: hypothetical protein COS57_16095 [Syntrophobacterales bacterium CG03_land_8_20_14_0_80_58_14]|nr:MAG: hypothetical protein COS57_16095 [Syntrophobacterales bacterium CG03_land_8_20_14_0_80_58_14]
MCPKNLRKTLAITVVTLAALLIGGAATVAGAFSVDVGNLSYSDDSGRSVQYDFTAGAVGTIQPNAILLDGSATITRPTGETGTSYFWGAAPGMPAVTVTKGVNKGTVGPTLPATEGVAVLYAGGPSSYIPPSTLAPNWFHSLHLSNFNVDLTAQKAYHFSIGLGRDETSGPFNNASVNITWVKGLYNGTYYAANTLIIQAKVENGDSVFWQSVPVVRTDLTPATTTLMLDLSVGSGSSFFALVAINGGGMQNLLNSAGNGCTLTTAQGSFQRFPDLYPYIYMEERSASTAPQASVTSQHWPNGYSAGLFVDDPLHAASAVTVNGFNNVSNLPLTWNESEKRWYNTTPVTIGTSPVTSPWPAYTFTFTPQAGGAAIAPVTKSVTGYVSEFATNLQPSGNISANPVFSWTAAQGAGSYGIELSDVNYYRIWNSYNIPPTQTSVPYAGGPALVNGNTYNYYVTTNIEQGGAWNSSFAQGSFTYNGASTSTVSFNGTLLDSGNTPVNGGLIEMGGNAAIHTATNATGFFTLNGLPSGTPFSVRMSPPAANAGTYVPTYSQTISATAPFTAARSYTLFSTYEFSNWRTAAGTGVIRGRVMNSANLDAGYVSGAVVTYTSALGNASYRVMYEDNTGNLTTGGGTYPNGRFMILDMAPGDIVTVQAANSNYSLQPTVFGNDTDRTLAGSVYQGLVRGEALSGRVAIGGHIMNNASPALGIKNATIEQVGATNPDNATNSNGDGSFYLSVPVSTPLYLKFSKPLDTTLAPTYTANMSFAADAPSLGDFNLFSTAQIANWNGAAGKGIIRARVKDAAGNYIGGAVVTAQGLSKSYPVCYDDACTSTLTATVASSGRYVVKNVDAGDTVTVTAQPMAGWTFNTRTFHTYADSMHQGSVTGTASAVVTPHPEAATIQSRFEAAMASFNLNDFTNETGFGAFISSGFLDRGQNKAQFIAEAQQARADKGPFTWTIQSILGTGDLAVINLIWMDGETDTLYFRKEGELWMLYGNQKLFDVWANSGHQMYSTSPNPYWVSLEVREPASLAAPTITGVNVTGPGLPTEGVSLNHDTVSGQWRSWSSNPSETNLSPQWTTAPQTPLDYTFTISYTGGTGVSPEIQTFQVKSFVNVAPLQPSLTPAADSTATRPLMFSWASAGEGFRYRVEVNDISGNRIWESDDLTGTSVAYGGPALGGGQYMYNLVTKDQYDNNSFIFTSFQMPQAVSVTGKVYNWAGTTPLAGASVELLGSDAPQSTTTDASGSFTLDNIAAGQNFYLRFRATGLRDVYTRDMAFNAAMPLTDLGTYNVPTDADLAGFALQTGKGLIAGRVLDQQLGNGGRVAGATVTATSSSHPAPGYTVTYRDQLGNLGGTATYSNGRYYVLNVDGGDTVTVTATKANRQPVQRTFHTFSGAVNEGSLRPAAPAYDVSFGGTVYDAAGNAIGGTRVEIDSYSAKYSIAEATTGAYQLNNLPRDVNMNLKITKDGYRTAYTGGFSLGASVADIPLTLFTPNNLGVMGVTAGNGLIAGRVVNDALSPLAGAAITVASNNGQTYQAHYGQGTATATLADGTFWIPNVVAGDVVTITVTHPGYSFVGVTYLNGYADAVTEKLFIGSLFKGDINGDGKVDLADAVLTLKIMAGLNATEVRANYQLSSTDVNGDGKVGQHELLAILQYLAGLRVETLAHSMIQYTSDANTVLLDHFDGATGASILAFSETGAACGSLKTSAEPSFSYGSGPAGLDQSLTINPPTGQPTGSGTYLKYPGGQLLSQPNGTLEFWTYLTSYNVGLLQQGPYPGSCAGWTFSMGVNASGQLYSGAWAAFNLSSGATLMPLNAWTHVAATWGSAGAKLYINGVLVGSDANKGMPASGYGGSVLLNYGAGALTTHIDELRISNIQRNAF